MRWRLAWLVVALIWLGTATAQAATTKVVRYHGYSVRVPRSWPVLDLSRDPSACVRYDRHAVYLGRPSGAQRCPAHAAGRRRAILLPPPARPVRLAPRSAPHAHAAGGVYTGPAFDACSTPSESAMSAWSSSSYRGIGVYIGGANEACSQPNLTSTWVRDEIAAGWHLILTYVGLQAPSNTCGCASITPSQATVQGTAAADDAVSDAQALAIPAGNPIYFDMEAYSRGGTNTSSVLAFLGAWTTRLHALGYQSGVYSSGASGMVDLANQQGTGYTEPDDIWFAEWNGSQTTSSGYVPAAYWSGHQRIHQYDGGHDETHGGVTINIDGDQADAATANSSSASTTSAPPLPATPPVLSIAPASSGVTTFSASWPGAAGVTGWRVLGGQTAAALAGVGSARVSGAVTRIAVRSSAPYYALQALGAGNQVLGTSPAVPAPAHLAVYGQSAFVPATRGGVGGLPVGCYTGHWCSVSTTMTAGRTLVARTGPELVGPNNAGIVYFRLTSAGSALLLHARSHRLLVHASLRDGGSGQSATSTLSLIPFSSSGRAAVARLSSSPTLKIIGLTHFVFVSGTGGILAGCIGAPLCAITTTLSVGRTTIASTGPEMLGANELGYLIFKLTPTGRRLLARAPGNNLLAHLTLASTGTQAGTTTANVSLVAFR